MDVDSARDHVVPLGVDDFVPFEVDADRGDFSVPDGDIREDGIGSADDGSPLDYRRVFHASTRLSYDAGRRSR